MIARARALENSTTTVVLSTRRSRTKQWRANFKQADRRRGRERRAGSRDIARRGGKSGKDDDALARARARSKSRSSSSSGSGDGDGGGESERGSQGWQGGENGSVSNRPAAKKEFISGAGRVHSSRNKPGVSGGYVARLVTTRLVATTRHPHTPTDARAPGLLPGPGNSVQPGCRGGCAERDDLMPELPHPGMRVVCGRFSKIIWGHPRAADPAEGGEEGSSDIMAPFEYITAYYVHDRVRDRRSRRSSRPFPHRSAWGLEIPRVD